MASKKQQREARTARERLQAHAARREVHDRDVKRRVRDNIAAIAGVIAVGALAAVVQTVYFTAGPGAPNPESSASAQANVGNVPDPNFAEYQAWEGELVLNDIPLGIEIDGRNAPQAASSFVSDIIQGYFPGKTCHRLAVDPDFQMLQCGSVDGAGSSDPGYSFGPIENAPVDDFYPAGTIAMARAAGDAYSNGHQFFIVFGDSKIPSDAAGGYTVVGHVTSGLERLVAEIADAGIDPEQPSTGGGGAPIVPVTITSADIDA